MGLKMRGGGAPQKQPYTAIRFQSLCGPFSSASEGSDRKTGVTTLGASKQLALPHSLLTITKSMKALLEVLVTAARWDAKRIHCSYWRGRH